LNNTGRHGNTILRGEKLQVWFSTHEPDNQKIIFGGVWGCYKNAILVSYIYSETVNSPNGVYVLGCDWVIIPEIDYTGGQIIWNN
jgi:hypothetical protein